MSAGEDGKLPWVQTVFSISLCFMHLFPSFHLFYSSLPGSGLSPFLCTRERGRWGRWLTGSLLLSLYPFCTNSQGRQNLIGPICIRCLFWDNHLWPEWQSHCVLNMATEILPWWVELVLRRRDLPQAEKTAQKHLLYLFYSP